MRRSSQLQIRPLVIHGVADSNVHLQNSANLVEAMARIDMTYDSLPFPNSNQQNGGDGLVCALSKSTASFFPALGKPAVDWTGKADYDHGNL